MEIYSIFFMFVNLMPFKSSLSEQCFLISSSFYARNFMCHLFIHRVAPPVAHAFTCYTPLFPAFFCSLITCKSQSGGSKRNLDQHFAHSPCTLVVFCVCRCCRFPYFMCVCTISHISPFLITYLLFVDNFSFIFEFVCRMCVCHSDAAAV